LSERAFLKKINEFKAHQDEIVKLRWVNMSYDAKTDTTNGHFVSIGRDKTIKLWDTRQPGKSLREMKFKEKEIINSVEVLPHAEAKGPLIIACLTTRKDEIQFFQLTPQPFNLIGSHKSKANIKEMKWFD